jgi:hypothetical protein
MENNGGYISTGESIWFIHQSSLAILQTESSSSKAGGSTEGNYGFCLRSMSFINEIWGSHRHYYNVGVVLGFRSVSENTRCQNSRQDQHNHFHTSKGYLTRYKFLYHGADGFTSPPKEGVLRIFVAVKNQLPSDGFEPVNIGPHVKHANH